MAKIDDLTIFLRAVDKTKQTFGKVNSRLEKMGKIAKIATRAVAAVGTAAVAGFTAAVLRGQEFVGELNAMSTALGIGKQEADALYQILKQSNPAAEIDRVKEGVLTLTEAFFDARAESGPLFDLMKDFGADIDFSVEGPREQLAEFLRVMKQIPDETVRVGGAISVLGGDDAKAFLPLIRNVELLDERIGQLTGSITDIPNIFSEEDIKALERAKLATDQLDAEWENFGKTASVIVAPAIETTNRLFAEFIKGAREGLRKFLGDIGLVENRDRITQINSQLTETTKLISTLESNIEKREGFKGGIFAAKNADVIANQKERVGELTSQLSDLRLELLALTTPDKTLPDVIEENLQTAQTTTIPSVTNVQSANENLNGPIEDFGPPVDLNTAIDVERLGEAYSATSEQLKLFSVDTDEARANTDALQSVLHSAGSALGSLGDAFAKNKKQARAFVAIQEILAVVSAYSAASQALADVTNPTQFQKFAAYASVLARGLAAVAAIKRAGSSIGSAGGGASSSAASAEASSSATATNATQQAANQTQTSTGPNVTIQLSGRGRFESEMVEDLVSEMQRLGVLRNNVNIAA